MLIAARGARSQGSGNPSARITARPGRPLRDAPRGFTALDLVDQSTGRGGRLYVPASYSRETPAPLVVLLHGAGQGSRLWESQRSIARWADAIGAVILAPDSRRETWDLVLTGGYGEDVRFLDQALRWTFARCNIHPRRVAIGGFSDGASVALSYGLANGDFFGTILAFSPGFMDGDAGRGSPRVFVSHGRSDQILSFRNTEQGIVPLLRRRKLTVEFMPFDGGHTIPADVGDAAFRWFASLWR